MFLNKSTIIARLTHTPEITIIANGVKKARLTLANNTKWRDQQGQTHEQTYYYEAVCWRKLADVAEEYAIKGQELYLEGRLVTDNYESRDGTKKQRTYILVDTLQLGQKPAGSDGHKTAAEKNADQQREAVSGDVVEDEEDDIRAEQIPF
jgi:single-strand DNA-binding protein